MLRKHWKMDNTHTLAEYMSLFGEKYESGELWDFDYLEFLNGAIEPQEGMVYWKIGDRVYETTL